MIEMVRVGHTLKIGDRIKWQHVAYCAQIILNQGMMKIQLFSIYFWDKGSI